MPNDTDSGIDSGESNPSSEQNSNLYADLELISRKTFPEIGDTYEEAALKAFDSQNRLMHIAARRRVASFILNTAAVAFLAVAAGFITMSGFAVYHMFLDSKWSDTHKDICEILKFGWTVSATVIVGKLSGLIFRD